MSSNLYPHLLSPGRIGSMETRNRIAVTAMGVSLSEEDGTVGEQLMAYHEAQARGGAGLIITGVAGVAWPVGAVCWKQTAISDDRFIPKLSELTARVHRHGARIAAQLHHGGQVAGYSHSVFGHPLWVPAMPRAPKGNFTDFFLMEELAGLAGMKMPEFKVMEQADIDLVVEQFRAAARRAVQSGFDAIEIHSGHGYLLSSFISPATNRRQDAYGGSLEARMKLPIDVLRAVRSEVGPDFPVWIKLDTREVGKDGGITIEDGIAAAQLAEAAGADAITATTYHETGQGALHSQSHTPHEPDYNLEATARMRAAVSIPMLGSGRIEPESADRAIGKGNFEFVAMGRKLLADPDLPNKLAAGRPDRVRPCIYCYTCISAIYMGGAVKCAVNPELANEAFGSPAQTTSALTVAVIGGGPGGMESARRLAALGHKPILIERSDRLGGTLRFASLAYPANERLLNWLQSELAEAQVDVRLSTEATPDLLRKLGVDTVIVASGAVRGMPDIPGNDQDHVYSGDDMRQLMMGESSDALKRKTGLLTRLATKVGAATGATANLELVRKATHAWMPIGNHVAIIGGELVGLELAEFLNERGRRVSVIEAAPRLGKGLQLVRRMRILTELAEHGVALHGGAKDIAIEAKEVRFTDAEGQVQTVRADTVIVAQGADGNLALAESLKAAGFKVHAIGDANGVGYINEAMRGAAQAVRAIAG